MPGRRPDSKGSFGGQLHEVVKHFPHPPLSVTQQADTRADTHQEKRDIHAMLFDMAWRVEGRDGSAR